MKERLQQLQAQLDAMTLRERGMVFLAAIGVLYLLTQMLLLDPLETRQKTALARLHELQEEIVAYDEQARAALAQQMVDPDEENHRLKTEIETQIAQVEHQIGNAVQGLIAPTQMAQILEQVLQRQGKLVLLAVENLPPTPLGAEKEQQQVEAAQEQNPDTTTAKIYKHRVRLHFSGSYLDALDYLRELKQLPWQLYWDALELAAAPYPKIHITVVVYTLSLEEGWIGV